MTPVWKQGIHSKKWRENFPATKIALLFMTQIWIPNICCHYQNQQVPVLIDMCQVHVVPLQEWPHWYRKNTLQLYRSYHYQIQDWTHTMHSLLTSIFIQIVIHPQGQQQSIIWVYCYTILLQVINNYAVANAVWNLHISPIIYSLSVWYDCCHMIPQGTIREVSLSTCLYPVYYTFLRMSCT